MAIHATAPVSEPPLSLAEGAGLLADLSDALNRMEQAATAAPGAPSPAARRSTGRPLHHRPSHPTTTSSSRSPPWPSLPLREYFSRNSEERVDLLGRADGDPDVLSEPVGGELPHADAPLAVGSHDRAGGLPDVDQ